METGTTVVVETQKTSHDVASSWCARARMTLENFAIILPLWTFQVDLKFHAGGNFDTILRLWTGTALAELRNLTTGGTQAELHNLGICAICQKQLRKQSCAILQVAQSGELRTQSFAILGNQTKELCNASSAIQRSFGIGLYSARRRSTLIHDKFSLLYDWCPSNPFRIRLHLQMVPLVRLIINKLFRKGMTMR